VSWRTFSGWLILIIVLAVAAHKLGAEPVWIGIGALALVGPRPHCLVRHV